MPIRDVFKISRKTFLNPSGWIGYESLKVENQTIWTILKNTFTTPKPTHNETFEQAVTRLKLSEASIQTSIKSYRTYALVFLLLGIAVLIYSFYLLIGSGTFTGWLLGIATSALLLSQAFKYDFWAFQMKQRHLGVTYAEWRQHLLKSKRTST